MTKKQEEEFLKILEEEFQKVGERGVLAGMKAAYKQILDDIDSGLTTEQLRNRICGHIVQTDIFEQKKVEQSKEKNN